MMYFSDQLPNCSYVPRTVHNLEKGQSNLLSFLARSAISSSSARNASQNEIRSLQMDQGLYVMILLESILQRVHIRVLHSRLITFEISTNECPEVVIDSIILLYTNHIDEQAR